MSESATFESLSAAALALPEEQREELVHRLLNSLNDLGEPGLSKRESEQAWAAEINRRIAAAESGEDPGIPNEIVFDPNRLRQA
jgi:putative addiction module component (TIGR02574 family)